MQYKYDHMGIPTTEKREGEQYMPDFKMWVSGYHDNEFRIQWHRYENGCPLHPLIQTVPHVAFRVDDMKEAIKDKKILLGPYFPLEGYEVAMVECGGAVIEFVKTILTEEEINARAKKRTKTIS